MLRQKTIMVIIGLGLFVSMVISPVNAQEPTLAPLSPEMQEGTDSHFGFVPPSMALPHLTGRQFPDSLRMPQAPSKWDWREQGKVTSIKNQGACGACYAFASLGNIESKMLIDGAGSFDFSENNAKECNYDQASCNGYNYQGIANLLSQEGVVLESCDPYVASDVSCKSTCTYIKALLDWRRICSGSVPSTTLLQDYIYTYGPVYTALYAGDDSAPSWDSEFSTYDGSYTLYYTGSDTPNHAVLIVGWDDDLAHAGGTGAWIVKNSWGTSWGGTCGYGSEGGYFTIAYGSASIGSWSSYMYDWQNYDENDKIMYYDEGGMTNSLGYYSTTAWGMCKFTPSSDVYIHRVEFWTDDVTTDIDIYIYDNFNGSSLSGLLASKLNISYDEAGYHSAALDSPPQITAGNDIYAVVKFTNQSYQYPLAIDVSAGAYETGTTYCSGNGANGTWNDVGTSFNSDVAIRIRTNPSLVVSADDLGENQPHGYSLSHNYPNPFNPSTTIDYTLRTGSRVEISIYNILGQKINTIVDESKPAGKYSVCWNGRDGNGRPVASGVYLYQIRAGEYIESKKMLLLK